MSNPTFGIVPTYTPSTFFWANPDHNVNKIQFSTGCSKKLTDNDSKCKVGLSSTATTADVNTCYDYELCKNYQASTEILQRSGTDGRYQDLRIQLYVSQLRLFNSLAGITGMCIAIYFLRK